MEDAKALVPPQPDEGVDAFEALRRGLAQALWVSGGVSGGVVEGLWKGL